MKHHKILIYFISKPIFELNRHKYISFYPFLLTDSDYKLSKGAQWLSGRVLDSRPKGRGFEPHPRHCVVILGQDTFILA